MDNKRFAIYTESILKKLPYWFEIKKKSKSSMGAAFLNVTGLELDDVRFILDYAYAQTYIGSIDIEQLDIIYKAELKDNIDTSKIQRVYYSEETLNRKEDLVGFCGYSADDIRNPEIFDKSNYFIDEYRKILYVHKPYDSNNKNKYGAIMVRYNNEDEEYPLNIHHVWNFLDEFGMLVDCPRLTGEKNYNYKLRIMDVFKHIANSSKEGLANGIARELDLRKTIIWEDGSKDLIIKEKMVIINKIYLDDELVKLDDVFINSNNNIVIKGSEKYKDKSREVSYIIGLEMHQLCNYDDVKLYNELINVDGTATDLLKYYTERLNILSPIKWGDFIWNESYWNTSEEEIEGNGFISNLYDGKISGFKNYKAKK